MPLKRTCSRSATSDNIREMIGRGYPQRQAVAIALTEQRRACGARKPGRAAGKKSTNLGIGIADRKALVAMRVKLEELHVFRAATSIDRALWEQPGSSLVLQWLKRADDGLDEVESWKDARERTVGRIRDRLAKIITKLTPAGRSTGVSPVLQTLRSIRLARMVQTGEKIDMTLYDVRRGRVSLSSARPLEVKALAGGRFYVVDGAHRVVEGLLAGRREMLARVVPHPYPIPIELRTFRERLAEPDAWTFGDRRQLLW